MPRRKRTTDEVLLDVAARAAARRGLPAPAAVWLLQADGRVVEVLPSASPAREMLRPSGREAIAAAVLEALADVPAPLQARQLARRCGLANTGHFRGVLSWMRHGGKLLLLRGEGYWRADRPVPGGLFPAA